MGARLSVVAIVAIALVSAVAAAGTSPRPHTLSRFMEQRSTARRHDGTWTNGMSVAARNLAHTVFDTIRRDLPAFNAYNAYWKISNGPPKKNQQTQQVEPTPFAMSDMYAIAGTASNLLGCREQIGHDLDFWSKGDITRAGANLLRLEFTPVADGQQDHIWNERGHYQGVGSQPSTPVRPHKTEDAEHLNPGWVGNTPPGAPPAGGNAWIGTTIEFDIWAQRANMWDGQETDRIRRRVNQGGGMQLQFKHNQKLMYVYTLPCADLIRQKVGLIRSWERQRKGSAAHHYQKGQGKFKNDAGDLHCMCHHNKCQDEYNAQKSIRDICDIDWLGIQNAINTLTPVAYHALVTTAIAAGNAPVHTQAAAPALVRREMAKVDQLNIKSG